MTEMTSMFKNLSNQFLKQQPQEPKEPQQTQGPTHYTFQQALKKQNKAMLQTPPPEHFTAESDEVKYRITAMIEFYTEALKDQDDRFKKAAMMYLYSVIGKALESENPLDNLKTLPMGLSAIRGIEANMTEEARPLEEVAAEEPNLQNILLGDQENV